MQNECHILKQVVSSVGSFQLHYSQLNIFIYFLNFLFINNHTNSFPFQLFSSYQINYLTTEGFRKMSGKKHFPSFPKKKKTRWELKLLSRYRKRAEPVGDRLMKMTKATNEWRSVILWADVFVVKFNGVGMGKRNKSNHLICLRWWVIERLSRWTDTFYVKRKTWFFAWNEKKKNQFARRRKRRRKESKKNVMRHKT